MKSGRPSADSKPCVKNPWNAGLYCDKHNCEKCGWNPEYAKEIHKKFMKNASVQVCISQNGES